MSKLKISNELSLPLDFTTQTQAILAKRGVGKSYTASVEAEELLKASQQVVVIDPVGSWWGLRSSADGKSEGFPIAVFGGEHGNVPLDEHAGEIVATAIVERRFSAIIDLSLFRKGQMQRFMSPFLETLYRLNREAMHLFVDEADAVAPQRPFGDEARTLGAMEDVVRRGRRRGIGCTLITQRPSVLNKNVLTQCEILCAMRLVHPRDIDAIEEWVNVHADPQQAKRMIDSLPTLPVGTAWFWSPGWGDIFKQVRIRERETFDSSATPKAGEKAREPKVLAPIDIERLGAQIQSTVEQVKANDPASLKKQIADLQRQLAQRPREQVTKEVQKIVEKPVVTDGQVRKVEQVVTRLEKEGQKRIAAAEKFGEQVRQLEVSGQKLVEQAREFSAALGRATVPAPAATRPAPARQPVASRQPVPRPERQATPARQSAVSGTGGDLPKGERAVMNAVAQYPQGVSREQLSVLTGYKRSSRDTYLQRLREREFVWTQGDTILPTDAGIAALGDSFQPLPTGEQLQQYWLDRLPEGERRVLEVLIGTYPEPCLRERIDEVTGYRRSSRDTYLQRLGARKLVEQVGRGAVKASDTLFETVPV